MGLRLSLGSSDSDSSIGRAGLSSTVHNRDHRSGSTACQNPSGDPFLSPLHRSSVETAAGSSTPRSVENLIRELELDNASQIRLWRLSSSNPQRSPRLTGRAGAFRSNSVSSSTVSHSNVHAPSMSTSQGSRLHGRQYQTNRRTRVSEPVEPNLIRIDSSNSDSEGDDVFRHLRLPAFVLRHLNSASRLNREHSLSQPDEDLIRTLRASAARLTYNVDRLTQNKGECSICLEDMAEGNLIARLPCLCIYHKKCLDAWFEHRPVCPEHPGD